jgi:hypothetical protein
MRQFAAAALLLCAGSLSAQTGGTAAPSTWSFTHRLELRANYRDSNETRFQLKFPFPSDFLPVGQTFGFMETVDAGRRVELSVAQIKLDANYGTWFAAHTQLHFQDKYRRNPTSEDRQIDADELWVRIGEKPDFLERPAKTSFFLQAGKFPHMERQPIRLLESYGLAATAFNRMEDVGFLGGGTVGRNFYWRLSGTSGNPLYFRDANALAGDNGIKELLQKNPDPDLKSGFPILYNAETEGYFLKTDHVQFGQGLGYRWQNDAQNFGFDLLAFHYRRTLADEEKLYGTFYGGDLDILNGPELPGVNVRLPIRGRGKEETGVRLYTEWKGLTSTLQATRQTFAGMRRDGEEWEVGYQFTLGIGPQLGGEALLQSIMPVARISALQNDFKGPPTYPSPSIWWNWVKIDYGARIGLAKSVDLTIERAKHNIVAPKKVDLSETLVTLRVRV